MFINVYSLYDTKAANYRTPFFVMNDAIAERVISGSVLDADSELCQHAEDFTLFRIGSFDSDSGRMIPEDAPVCVRGVWEIKATIQRSKLNVIKEELSSDE